MKRIVLFVLVIAAAVGLLVSAPVLYLIGVGLKEGHDVAHGLSVFIFPAEQRETVPLTSVAQKPATVTWLGDIAHPELNEASGLAWSQLDDDVLFAINDSGSAPLLFALSPEGTHLGEWTISAPLVDWEDLAAFTFLGQPYLLIADTGDNFAWRQSVTLHVVAMPTLTSVGSTLTPEWSFDVVYPEGQRDCEAVAVDGEAGVVYLVSKRRVPAELFKVPLQPGGPSVIAEPVGELMIPQPTAQDVVEDSEWGYTRSQPTGMDLQGERAVVLTYKHAYYFVKGTSWLQTFAGVPQVVRLPKTGQQESIALHPHQNRLVVTVEREEGSERAGIYEASFR